MKTISLAVSTSDYEAFRRAAKQQGRSIAELIREAMATYRAEHLPERTAMRDVPVLVGHRPTGPLPGRDEIWNEIAPGLRTIDPTVARPD